MVRPPKAFFKLDQTMERVVYLLGAGFSAPLNIPVIRNFLERSKDLYFENRDQYAHFTQVFDTIKELSVCKNYYAIDLFNIEDILSLLEMRAGLANEEEDRRNLVRYIADVIRACTPTHPGRGNVPDSQNWLETIFGSEPWSYYGLFAATILNCALMKVDETKGPDSVGYRSIDPPSRPTEYAVITLNYDLVLENLAEYLNNEFGIKQSFRRDFKSRPDEGGFDRYLAKLHGSIDTGEIVPPTWNKRLVQGIILRAWQIAHWLLANANHMRIIGYSLPEADSYIKYLLRAAIVSNTHLKTFDVICLDRNGDVRKRYDDFIRFPNYRFRSRSVEDYLKYHLSSYGDWPHKIQFEQLEEAHQRFFDKTY